MLLRVDLRLSLAYNWLPAQEQCHFPKSSQPPKYTRYQKSATRSVPVDENWFPASMSTPGKTTTVWNSPFSPITSTFSNYLSISGLYSPPPRIPFSTICGDSTAEYWIVVLCSIASYPSFGSKSSYICRFHKGNKHRTFYRLRLFSLQSRISCKCRSPKTKSTEVHLSDGNS